MDSSEIQFENMKMKKISLGNSRARYNSYVDGVRNKFYINSMYYNF